MASPFMTTAASGSSKFSFSRITEAVVIAAITGGLTMWVTVSVISAELGHMKTSMAELKTELRDLRRDVFVHMLNDQKPISNNAPH